MASARGTLWPSFLSLKAGRKSLVWKVYSLNLEAKVHPYLRREGIREASINKTCYFFNVLPQAHTVFTFLTNYASKTRVSLPCQFLLNLLFPCLKSIKAAYVGHFLGLISMRCLCAQLICVSFSPVNRSPVAHTTTLGVYGGRGISSSSTHHNQEDTDLPCDKTAARRSPAEIPCLFLWLITNRRRR